MLTKIDGEWPSSQHSLKFRKRFLNWPIFVRRWRMTCERSEFVTNAYEDTANVAKFERLPFVSTFASIFATVWDQHRLRYSYSERPGWANVIGSIPAVLLRLTQSPGSNRSPNLQADVSSASASLNSIFGSKSTPLYEHKINIFLIQTNDHSFLLFVRIVIVL